MFYGSKDAKPVIQILVGKNEQNIPFIIIMKIVEKSYNVNVYLLNSFNGRISQIKAQIKMNFVDIRQKTK